MGKHVAVLGNSQRANVDRLRWAKEKAMWSAIS